MKIEIITKPKKVVILKNSKRHEYTGKQEKQLKAWIAKDSSKLKQFVTNKI